MQKETLCKKILEVILGNKIGKITKLSRQKIINNTYGAKGVRLGKHRLIVMSELIGVIL